MAMTGDTRPTARRHLWQLLRFSPCACGPRDLVRQRRPAWMRWLFPRKRLYHCPHCGASATAASRPGRCGSAGAVLRQQERYGPSGPAAARGASAPSWERPGCGSPSLWQCRHAVERTASSPGRAAGCARQNPSGGPRGGGAGGGRRAGTAHGATAVWHTARQRPRPFSRDRACPSGLRGQYQSEAGPEQQSQATRPPHGHEVQRAVGGFGAGRAPGQQRGGGIGACVVRHGSSWGDVGMLASHAGAVCRNAPSHRVGAPLPGRPGGDVRRRGGPTAYRGPTPQR